MKSFDTLSDRDLVDLLRQGDPAAFEELYNRYWSKLYGAAFKRIRIKEVAEEIVQDFFTSLWMNREKLVIHTSFQNYLYNAVRYLVFGYFGKECSRKTYESFITDHAAGYDNSTEETIVVNDLEKNLDMELHHLPDRCRSVFELSRRQYKSNKEIAVVLGISEKTVENHLTKALRILRINMRYLSAMLLFVVHW